ncbi:cytochrome ubiquinol oxidase subunit I [Derxia lacustris]|uniref:cytochrome ubiquinol oxidase subunit I n=1 Tax=Derxia lacustris TaxID=764842 RepID=UPI000A174606|nr:cytochrome ubiquinol oxidase subunit I [Derxia lacustris]
MDAFLLSRLQFAANITFHILFPTITIALGWLLLFFKLRFNASGAAKWNLAYRFWVKVFALTFAIGVVSGVTMSFQFGTNWPGFMATVGNVAGPLLGYEVLTAFFLEATFLSVMLFGQQRVGARLHTAATFLVAGGTTLSAFWIIALNSWMQTPTGFEMRDGVAHVTSWIAVIFNPSMPYRLVHMLLASGLTMAFLVAGVSAYRWLRGDRGDEVRATLRTAITLAAILIPLQIVAGDLHGLNTLHHQPAKLAAMEGIWKTERRVPAVLFALPDEATRSNRYEIAIPALASLYLGHDFDAEIPGLDQFEGKHPPVAPVFFAFRIMVGVGMLMLALSWTGVWQLRRGGELKPWLACAFVAATFLGWIALVAGWYTTEIGRQPWIVTGVLTAADAATTVAPANVAFTLAMYLTLYLALIVAYVSVVFHMARKAKEIAAQPDDPRLAGQGADTPAESAANHNLRSHA